MIDLTRLRDMDVDADAGIARAEGGATWFDFDAATQAHGLVTPGGVVGSTGVAGLTLGGGIGHLTSDKKPLRLVETRTVGDGVVILTYEPVRDPG